MVNSPYQRSVEQLKQVASLFWSAELSQQEAELSILPMLLETQEAFISILNVQVATLDNLFEIVNAASMSANLFLKHLAVLADFGGEPLQRISNEFNGLFSDGGFVYLWSIQGKTHEQIYRFRALPHKKFSNTTLGLSGKKLFEKQPLSDLQKDAIAILMLGSSAKNEYVAEVLSKCEIGEYIGQPGKLDQFIRQRYLWVSRITGGSQSNNLGQLAQKFVRQYLEEHLGIASVEITTNGHIPGVRHTGNDDSRETTFDLVIRQHEKYVAVEISFQVTTNSVIERKSGQAQARYLQIHELGHKIAYILDGAGNFQRLSALRTICSFSDCTVAFSPSELDMLCQFVRDYFGS